MIVPRHRYSLALSLISSPVRNNLWELLDKHTPEETFINLISQEVLHTQSYVARKYGDDPWEAACGILNTCSRDGIEIMDLWDPQYPSLLKEIHRPPLVLYFKGERCWDKTVSIVGTRDTDPSSAKGAYRLSRELSQAGYTVISGMAMGVDREAHRGALENGGKTIGILANGINVIYPAKNFDLYEKINASHHSALISEYPPGSIAGKWTFARRNRIISGMSRATVVVKAGEKSGSLITAGYALEQNRDVFVCPGHIYEEGYEGCFHLMKSGAFAISGAVDILKEYHEEGPSERNPYRAVITREQPYQGNDPGDSRQDMVEAKNRIVLEGYPDGSLEHRIIDLLSKGSLEVDSLVGRLQSGIAEINETVTSLEIFGVIMRRGNKISLDRY